MGEFICGIVALGGIENFDAKIKWDNKKVVGLSSCRM
jgi:hypothetical protein